jgi:uncharacterized integral membrane protein
VSDDINPRGDRPGAAASREIPWKVVGAVALAVYAVVFLLLNDERQDVSFVFFTVRTRLIWLILLSMALGGALTVVVPRWWRSRKDR